MRILHINRNYIFNKLHSKLIEALDRQQGLKNFVFVPASKEQKVKFNVDCRTKVVKCFNLSDRYVYHLKQYKITRSIQKNFKINEFDLLHAYTLFTDGSCAYQLSKRYGIPYVVAIRNTDLNDFFAKIPFLRPYGRKILKNAKAIFFLSEEYKKILCKKYISDKQSALIEDKMYVIANGMDEFWLENLNNTHRVIDKNQVIKALYVGRIDRNKNIEATCRALQLLNERGYNFEFTVIGKVEDEAVFKALKKYSFVSYIPNMIKEDLIKEYRRHDMFVMPSFTETFGISYIEAMSQGLPVIYTKGQGFDGQFDEGSVGFHVVPNDPNNIADKIEELLVDYEKISQNCLRECVLFDWNSIANKYKAIYRLVTAEGSNSE